MYRCDTLGCPEYVSHPGQMCLACQQREEVGDDYDDESDYDDDRQNAERLCVKCGTRVAIINRACGMCSELHPYMV